MKVLLRKILSSILSIVLTIIGFTASIAPAVAPILTIVLIVKKCTHKPKITEESIEKIDQALQSTLKLYQNGEYTEFKKKSFEFIEECAKLPNDIGVPYSSSIHILLGRIYFEEGDYVSSKIHLQRFVDIFSIYEDEMQSIEGGREMYYESLAVAYTMLGSIAMSDQNWKDCEKYITEFIQVAKKTKNTEVRQVLPMMLVKFGHMACKLQNYPKAEELYNDLLSNKDQYSTYPEFDKWYSEAIYSLMAVYTAQLNFDKALLVYENICNDVNANNLDGTIMRNASMSLIATSYILANDAAKGVGIVNDFKSKEIAKYNIGSVQHIIANASEVYIKIMAGMINDFACNSNDIAHKYNDDVTFWKAKNILKYPNEYKYFVDCYTPYLQTAGRYEELDIHSTKLIKLFSTPDKQEENIDASLLKIECLINSSNLVEANSLAYKIYDSIKDNPLYFKQCIEVLSLLASIYSQLGLVEENQDVNNEIYNHITRHNYADIRQTNPILYAEILSKMFYDYVKFGDYKRALSIGEYITNVHQKVSKKSAKGYMYQAIAYRGLSDSDNMIKFGKLVLSSTIQPNLVCQANEIIGYGYMLKGDYTAAENTFSLALSNIEAEQVELKDKLLEDLANSYAQKGNYRKAQNLASRITGNNNEILLLIAWLSSNEEQVEKHIKEYYSQYFEELTKMSTSLSNSQLEIFAMNALNIRIVPSIAVSFPNSETCSQYAYNAILNFKGVALQTAQTIVHYIRKSNNTLLNSKLDYIFSLLSALEKTNNVQEQENIQNEINSAEIELKKELADLDDSRLLQQYSVDDIAKKLNNNDVAIELVECISPKLENEYVAFVLRKDWVSPKFIKLSGTKGIKSYFEKATEAVGAVDAMSSLRRLFQDSSYHQQGYQLIWSKLEPYINEGDNVYFSSDGLLHQINIEVLQDANGRRANEKWNLHRVSSTRELCMKKTDIKHTSAVLYGDLTYDMDNASLIAQSRATMRANDKSVSRGFIADSTLRAGWKSLPATKTEVNAISNMLESHKIGVKTYTGVVGNEESFKSLSGKKTPIIHLATHGFFYKNDDINKKPFLEQICMESQNYFKPDNSLKRSGLILAGAQRAWAGEQIPSNVEDGILLAEEIAAIDLSGTDLVVLSACETGLGEITSEGVFGLQRAFKKAGVQTLIMSLWRVDDNATSLFMRTFYKHWLDGKSKHEAFSIAQSTVRDNESYSNPYYWAAFIMLD